MSLARFELFSTDDCPVAQGVALALVHRRTFFRWEPGAGATLLRITDPDGEGIQLRDPVGMHDWIEDLSPDSDLTLRSAEMRHRDRELARAACHLPGRIAAITTARHARDLDLAQHFLHEALEPFEAIAGQAGPSGVDFLIAPALWRIDLLDRNFGTYLLSGLPGLRARIGAWLAAPHGTRVLNAAAERRYLAEVTLAGGALATGGHRCDWSRAFAPADPTPAVRPLWRRRTYPSWAPLHE